MLTKVEITNEQAQKLVLPLEYTDNGYMIREIEGLDPVKAVIVSSSFANQDGEQYQSSRRETRNIVIKLGLERGIAGSVRDLRNRLYSFFMPKTTAHMRFFSDDEPPVDIYGQIESCISPLFTQDPMATISLLCHKPDFYIPTPVIINGATVSNGTEIAIPYDGTIETGIVLTIPVNRDLLNFTVYHRSPTNKLGTLEFNVPLLSGDTMTINTNVGEKGAILRRSNNDTSLLYGITPVSTWITLFPGMNHIRVYSEGVPVPYTIEYGTKIGGL